MFLGIPLRVAACSVSNFGIAGTSTTWRNVRSVVKRQPIDSMKTLKGKIETEYSSKFDDDYMAVQDVKDLKNVIRQMFVDTDETQTEAEYDMEENYEAPIEHFEKFHDMNVREEKGYKAMVKKNIVGKRYFKEPRETNLLTYAAKKQVRHLHQLDPIEWTPEKLAESFPISVSGVKRLLKNNFEINVERIKRHDDEVASRWQLLESGKYTESISPITRKLYLEGKITKDHHAGNFKLPEPVPQKKIPESRPKKIGEHAAIVKYYVDLKTNTEKKEVTSETKNNSNLTSTDNGNDELSEYEQRDIKKALLPEFKTVYPTRKEVEDMKSASYLAAEKLDQNEVEIPQSQFEENLLQEFTEKHTKSSIDMAYEEWMQRKISEKSESVEKKPQPFDSKDFFEVIKKCNSDAIELHRDKNDAYLYDKQSGYQHTLGTEEIKRRIKIPREKYVPGALYRIDQKFYADDGQFLFKIYV